jgi:hypothetical protein
MSSSLMSAAPGVFCAPPPPPPVELAAPVPLAGAAAPGAGTAPGGGGGGIMPGGYWKLGGAGCDSGMNFTEMFKRRISSLITMKGRGGGQEMTMGKGYGKFFTIVRLLKTDANPDSCNSFLLQKLFF